MVRDKCTKAKVGRVIYRKQFMEAAEKNLENLKADPNIYKRRQAIVEHPFGTMKRSWSFDHIITKKGKDRASSDVGLIFIAYVLRRIFNILDFELLQNYLEIVLSFFLSFWAFSALQKWILRAIWSKIKEKRA